MIFPLSIVRQRVCLLHVSSTNQQCEYYSYVTDENTYYKIIVGIHRGLLVHEYEMNIYMSVVPIKQSCLLTKRSSCV